MHAVVVRCAFFVPQQFSRNDSLSAQKVMERSVASNYKNHSEDR